jgi:hypothetical protein
MTDVEAGGMDTRDFGFTETTTQGYGSKMKNAISGVFIGFLLFFGSVGLLIYNEGRAVKRAKDIDEGRDNVVQVDLNSFSNVSSLPSEYENKLIYATGDLNTNMASELLVDPIFGVSVGEKSTNSSSSSTNGLGQGALKLKRSVEMYQWQESSTSKKTKKFDGGTKTETTYNYDKTWSTSLIDSTRFKQPKDETRNPSNFPFESLVLEADPILLGNLIEVSERVIAKFNWFEPVPVALDDVPDASLKANLTLYTNSGFYYGGDTFSPTVGDTRITFAAVEPDTISIIAQVKKGSTSSNSNSDYNLDAYTTSRDGSLLLVKRGTFTSEELFVQADSENTTLAWILRAVGFLIMFLSILLVLQPLATAVDIIPFVGDFMQGGLESCIFPTIALIISIPVSLFVIAMAWIAYRPYISIPIVVISFLLIIGLCIRVRKAKQDIDESNDNGSIEEIKPKPNPYSSSDYGQPEIKDGAASSTTTDVASGGEGFGSALNRPAPSTPYVPSVYVPSTPYVEPDIKL